MEYQEFMDQLRQGPPMYGPGPGAQLRRNEMPPQNPEQLMSPLERARLEQFERIDVRNYNRALKRLGIQDPETAKTRLAWKGTGKALKTLGVGSLLGAGLGAAGGALFGGAAGTRDGIATGAGVGALAGGIGGGALALLAAAIRNIHGGIRGGVEDIDENRIRQIYDKDAPYSFYDSGYANAQIMKYMLNNMSEGELEIPKQYVI